MVQANPLSFLHFQSQGSLFSAVFLLLKVMAWMRSKVRAGMSLSLLQLHADHSALAVWSLPSQVRVLLLMSIHLGMRVYFASRRPWEASPIAAEEGWGLMGPGGGHPCPFPALRWLCPSVLCCQVSQPGAPQLGLAVSVYLLHSAVVPVLVWGDCQKFIFFSSPFSPDCQTGRALTPNGPSHKDGF